MAGHQFLGGFGVFMFLPAFGEHVFLARIQKRKLPNLGEIAGKPAFALQCWNATTAQIPNSLSPP